MKLTRTNVRLRALVLMACALAPAALNAADHDMESTAGDPTALVWHETYVEGYKTAQAEEKNLFVYFYDPANTADFEKFAATAESDATIRKLLASHVLAKVSLKEENTIDDSSATIVEHGAFDEMQGGAGIAILDLSHRDEAYYAYVVSVFPFAANPYARNGTISKFHLTEMLKLPAGTLTQRTMIFAVRVHEENPVSADSAFCSVLSKEAESHSQHQADIVDQGHHNWSTRFHNINARLSGGLTAQEVVAESWPGENLMQAAKECVYSWRRSPGHWGGVRARNDRFAYDIKRGRNGIWYATGLFARRN